MRRMWGWALALTRPMVPVPNGYRRILAAVNDGMARYDGLQTSLTHRFSRGFSLLVSYTWSHAVNTVEPDAPQQDPNDATLLGRAERATSLLDQRHRAVVSGWWQWRQYWSFGGITSLASGRPYNITTGVDNNGDGSFAGRPVAGGRLMGRNTGRGTPVYDVSPFVDREMPLAGDRGKLFLRAEVFNLLNHSNIVGRNGTWGNADTPLPGLGQPLGGINNVDPGREFQFEIRVVF